MKIIHLSDLHIGGRSRLTKMSMLKNARKVFNKICNEQQPASDYVVVITGDLVDNAFKSKKYKNAIDALKILQDYKVLIIPGNHDYGDGTVDDEKFVALFDQTFGNTNTPPYPTRHIIGGVAFWGLNSMAEKVDMDTCEGKLGEPQINLLENYIENDPAVKRCKKVLYLHHHPFPFPKFKGLQDTKKLERVIKGKVDALLFGHNHVQIEPCGLWSIPIWSNPGSSTHIEDYLPAGYRVFDLQDGYNEMVECIF
ncbi:MAG: hypothetical protein A2V67_14205 [Deltaproteobacteria bacterium RBG_13_61_14]|nr:MAG: hypothetical protein A2V67_14205 [Deltaproteobacteria bacterium RBG_13_61_14]